MSFTGSYCQNETKNFTGKSRLKEDTKVKYKYKRYGNETGEKTLDCKSHLHRNPGLTSFASPILEVDLGLTWSSVEVSTKNPSLC